MNIYDRKDRGLGTTLMPALQALAMQNAKQLQDARKQWNFKEDFMKGGGLNEDQASLMSNTMMSDPKVAPLFLKVLGEMKNQEAMQKQGGLGSLVSGGQGGQGGLGNLVSGGQGGQGGINLPGSSRPGLEGVNKPMSMLSAAPNTALGVKDILRENRLEKNRTDKLSKEQRVEQHQIEKGNASFKKEMYEKEEKRKIMLASLAAMKAASKSGNINSPFALTAMNIGNSIMPSGKNPFDYFKTPETQSLLTHSKALFGIGKEIFGSRITNADLPIIEGMLPNLMQNPATREMAIQSMEEIQQLAGKQYQIMQDIIDENGGREPTNLRDKVAKRFDKAWDEGSQNLTALLGMARGERSKNVSAPSSLSGKTMDEIGGWSGLPEGHVMKEHGKLFMKINGKRTEVVEAGSPGKYKRK